MSICRKCGNDNPVTQATCTRCGADLSEQTRTEEAPLDSGQELLQLATFHTISEADMVQELLESNGITTVLHGENDPIGAMSGAEPIILLVEAKDLARATELYEAFFAGQEVIGEDSSQAEMD